MKLEHGRKWPLQARNLIGLPVLPTHSTERLAGIVNDEGNPSGNKAVGRLNDGEIGGVCWRDSRKTVAGDHQVAMAVQRC